MSTRYFLILFVVLLCCLDYCPAQRCTADAETLKATIRHDEKLPEDFTLRGAEMPDVEQAILAVQDDAAKEKNSIREVQFCQFTPFLYQLQSGRIVTTTVVMDSDSSWLVGLGPKDEQYLLAGFSDPLAEFNILMKALNLDIENVDSATDIFDLYLRLIWGQKVRESIFADDMQLQSLVLSDFRMRYPLPKARALYVKWWDGMTPQVRKHLHKPEIVTSESEFMVNYFRYRQGQIVQESITVGKSGTVTVGPQLDFYPTAGLHKH